MLPLPEIARSNSVRTGTKFSPLAVAQSLFQSVSEAICFHHCGVYVVAPATRTRLHLAQPKPAQTQELL